MSLDGKSKLNTYKAVLRLDGTDNQEMSTSAGTAKYIEDGMGQTSALSINSTRVGIGTAEPQQELHVESDDAQIRISDANSSNTTTATASIEYYDRNDTALLGKVGYLSSSNLDMTIYNALAGDVNFSTSATQRMTILSGGNVGIGVTSPKGKLEVANTTGSTGAMADTEYNLILRNTSTANAHCVGMGFIPQSDDNTIKAGMIFKHTSAGNNRGDIQFLSRNTADNTDCVVDTDARMTILADGNVGIGTSSPSAPLHINKTHTGTHGGEQYGQYFLTHYDTSNTGLKQGLRIGATTQHAAGTVDDLVGILSLVSSDGSGTTTDCTGIYLRTDCASGSTITNAYGVMIAPPVGAGTISNRWGIYQSDTASKNYFGGRVSIGGTPNLAHSLEVRGTGIGFFETGVRINVDSSNSTITAGSVGSGTDVFYIGNQAITTSSDQRLKTNIVNTKSNGLEVINKFRVVDFTWNDPKDQCVNNRNARGEWTGFLAQEAAEVAPYAVNAPRPEGKEIDVDSPDTWIMEYGQLVPILAKAIQELSAKVEALENNNQTGDSNNDEGNQGNNNAGESSSESAGEDSGGAEGSGSDSSSSSDGESASSEPSSDDGNQGSGSSGSDASDDSEEGSGGDDSSGSLSGGYYPTGSPSGEWTKEQLKNYMDATSIAYNSGDTKDDLLMKIDNAS